MKKSIILYFKHIFFTVIVLIVAGIGILLYLGNSVKFNRNYDVNSNNIHNEGPYILYQDSAFVTINYVEGTLEHGIQVTKATADSAFLVDVYYDRDSTFFTVNVDPFRDFLREKSTYPMQSKIFAVSDIEGGYNSFRKLLIANHVIDNELNWTFNDGHLVLAGDFVDRGYFVTQVLYLIYRLEQQAEKAGGKVHYILGNHELMNMQGDHRYAADKYSYAASLLGLKHFELYDNNHTFLGRWMNSKNIVEKIGDYIFTHGGFHPEYSTSDLNIDSINALTRPRYGEPYYPTSNKKTNDLLFSYEKSPYWYRGFAQDDLSSSTIDSLLNHFGGKHFVIGHTLQRHVKKLYDGRVIAIDVQHPQEEWGSYLPAVHSEGLLIENGKLYRANDEGARVEL